MRVPEASWCWRQGWWGEGDSHGPLIIASTSTIKKRKGRKRDRDKEREAMRRQEERERGRKNRRGLSEQGDHYRYSVTVT